MNQSKSAVVLLSGGIDSATCMAIACEVHEEVIPVFIRYGQQTEVLERRMAQAQRVNLWDEYSEVEIPEVQVIDYSHVFSHFAEGVAESGKDFDHMEEEDGRSSGYVPMRNLHLIATAAGVADTSNAGAIYHGAQMGDESDYPDCRPVFIDSAAGAISRSVPDDQTLDLRVPLLSLSKPEVIKKGDEMGVDFEATYSCYTRTDPNAPQPCGVCPACDERADAFEEAGVEDPYDTIGAVHEATGD